MDKFTLSGQFEGYDSEILGGDSLMETGQKIFLYFIPVVNVKIGKLVI